MIKNYSMSILNKPKGCDEPEQIEAYARYWFKHNVLDKVGGEINDYDLTRDQFQAYFKLREKK